MGLSSKLDAVAATQEDLTHPSYKLSIPQFGT